MSARAYSETLAGIVGAPVLALANQELIYAVTMWACGHRVSALTHIVPAVCVCLSLITVMLSYRAWTGVGRGSDDEPATLESRARFLAILGMTIGLFSSAVILAQWAAIFVFDPCARA
jgi:hypothetical protein